jgi:hypothetical protein
VVEQDVSEAAPDGSQAALVAFGADRDESLVEPDASVVDQDGSPVGRVASAAPVAG